MTYYQNTINEMVHVILEKELPYENFIVIGNNSSGKSELLRRLLLKSDFGHWYFIDSVNRFFDIGQIFIMSGEASPIEFSEKIMEHRLMEDNYNLKDTFYYKGVPTAIENFYFDFESEIRRIVETFLGIKFEVRQSEVGYKVYLDGNESSLSSGYQALLRMFMEMEYVRRTIKKGVVVIDEIDEFLFAYNCGRIFEFLKQEYKEFSFIVTTHSADLIANAAMANLVLLSDGAYELLDAGDFNSISQVYNIFNSIFHDGGTVSEKEKIDIHLRKLLNNKIAGIWKDENRKELTAIKEMNLTKTQRVLIRQIEEW
jgi:ABC-type cobalamin/Fe3+-siderophores transport system ATPase subunit